MLPRSPLLALATALLLALALPAVAAADDAAVLYDPSRIAAIDLTIPAESQAALAAQPEEYVPITFAAEIDGRAYGPMPAQARLKGQDSFRPLGQKSAFKVKFPKTGRLLGLKGLTLNNMVEDPSMLHETLGYAVMREAGLPAPRTGFAYVRVNGEGYGLYLDLEPYDEVSLPRLFASTQHLYEADVSGVDVTPGAAPEFQVDEGDEDDRADLEALIAAANAPADTWEAAMRAAADLDQLTRFWAAEQYIGQWDGYSVRTGPFYPNNYYLHSDADGRFAMLPWGLDLTFTVFTPFPGDGDGVLVRRCLQAPACLAAFRAHLGDVARAAGAMDLPGRIDALAATVAAGRAAPSHDETGDAAWAAAVDATRAYVRDVPDEVAAYLGWTAGGPPAAGANAPSAPAAASPSASQAVRGPARLAVVRAGVDAADRRLDVLATIGGRASGTLTATFRSAGEVRRFRIPIDRGRRRAAARVPISARQAALGAGILTVTYAGDADTQRQVVRLRAAAHHAGLAAGRPRLAAGRLTARGTIAARARGVVQVELHYTGAGGERHVMRATAPIRAGRYALDVRLGDDAAQSVAARASSVEACTIYTGDLPRRIRGEMRTHEILPAPGS